MKKYIKLIVIVVIVLLLVVAIYFYLQNQKEKECLQKIEYNAPSPFSQSESYSLYPEGSRFKTFKTQEEAVEYCMKVL
ncbi:MAG: hypothetical protein WC099_02735 [Candidatus Paceibacterota bacterium]